MTGKFDLIYFRHDVWLLNNRGTMFSHEHETKDSNTINSDYWDFSFHEMAEFDIISNIEYIKKTTGFEKIDYVCHSQGCYQLFLGYTMDPTFYEKSVNKIATMGAGLKISKVVNFLFLLHKK